MKLYDVAIVGGGVAALTAAIYASRRKLATIVIAKDFGGQLATTDKVENYPGIDFATGPELVEKFKRQGEKFGAEFLLAGAWAIKKVPGPGTLWSEVFEITTDFGPQQAKTVIFAFGLSPREIGVPGERELYGKGVSYSANDQLGRTLGQNVAVVGGGSSALTIALTLAPIAQRVHLIHRRDNFRGEETLAEKVKTTSNITLHLGQTIEAILGSERVEAVKLNPGGETLSVIGLVLAIGYHAQTSWVREFVACDESGAIITNKKSETNVSGVFAAGDCTDVEYKQIPISSGEGATAAIRAYQYILAREGRRGAVTDWS